MTRRVVLVLGARGFIGRRIVHQLSSAQWAHPIAASRLIAEASFGTEVEKLPLDATSRPQLERALATADAVISCIAGTTHDILESGHALFEAVAHRADPPRVVWLSSIAAYGSACGSIDEQAPLLGDLGPYSSAKALIDTLAASLPSVTRLRPGIVYGPESPWWSDRIARLLVGRRLGDLGVAGTGICNLVHVDDVASAAVRAVQLECAGGEAFNLGSPNPPTWNEYFAAFARALGAAPTQRISQSRLMFEQTVGGPVLKVAEKLFGNTRFLASRPAIRPWLTTLCRHRIRMEVRKAESVLGIRWRALEPGLEEAAGWFGSGGRTP